ncbi:hypothetical protein [Luteimonas cucumeris]|uniref:hypothetical protein n=1 Tax=Luteimonas cucumeris TaxID=985012 RepID=UPI0011A2ADBE|nr:hypothetical protein [Luteimonas cucumeris]
MAAVFRVYGVLGSLTVRASSQQLVAAAKANAIGRVWRAANAAIKFQAITRITATTKAAPNQHPSSATQPSRLRALSLVTFFGPAKKATHTRQRAEALYNSRRLVKADPQGRELASSFDKLRMSEAGSQ